MLKPDDFAWIKAMGTPQPIGVSLHPLTLTGARDKVAKKTFIRARGYPNPVLEAGYQNCVADPSWKTYEVPCGHFVAVEMPDRLTEILLDAA